MPHRNDCVYDALIEPAEEEQIIFTDRPETVFTDRPDTTFEDRP